MTFRHIIAKLLVRYAPEKVVAKIGRAYMQVSNLLKYNDKTFPHHFTVEIGERCNRSCDYCSQSLGRPSTKSMPDDIFRQALVRLRDIKWNGPVSYHVSNEPLLDKSLVEKVKATVKALPGCAPTIVTNGDALNSAKAFELITSGAQRIMVSRHAPFSEIWDSRIDELARKWPGTIIITQVGVTIPRHKNDQWTTEGLPWQGKCLAPSLNVIINVNGDVQLCCCDHYRKHTFGNIMEKGLIEIWKNPEFVRIRQALRDGIKATPICEGCSGVL